MANDTTKTTPTFSIEYPADGYDATPTWAELYGTAFEDIDSLLADRLTEEEVQDSVDALLTGGDTVSLSYADANDVLTIDTSALDAEEVRDEVGTLLVGGDGINVAVNDEADTVTLSLASHAATHEKGGSDELTTFGDTTHDSVSTDYANIGNQPASYQLVTDGSVVDAIPQDNPAGPSLTEYRDETDIGTLLQTLIVDELPPQGVEKEAAGKITLKRGDYPGTVANVPLGTHLTLEGEITSHYVDGTEQGRDQDIPPTVLRGASGEAMFRPPTNTDGGKARFITLKDLELYGPGANDAGSLAIDSQANATDLDWVLMDHVVTQDFERHVDAKQIDNVFTMRDCHIIDFGGRGFLGASGEYALIRTNFWTADGTSPDVCAGFLQAKQANVINCKFITNDASPSEIVSLAGAGARFRNNHVINNSDGAVDGVSVNTDAQDVSHNIFRLTASGGGDAISVGGNPRKRTSVGNNYFTGAWSAAVRDNSNGQRPIYAFNRANPANAPNAGIVLDGSNGLSDVWLWSNGVDVLEQNSPSRVRHNGQIQMGGAPSGSNYNALDAGVCILDTSASPPDEHRVLDDGTLVGPL